MADNTHFKLNKKGVMLGLAALGLVIATAAAASYATKERIETAQVVTKPAPKPVAARVQSAPPQQQMAQAQPRCNDSNIVGTVLGGVGGGVVGSQIGSGTGNTAATIAGAMGGAYLGNQYIPTDGVTCRK